MTDDVTAAHHKALVEDSIRKIKATWPNLMERLRVAHVCEDQDNCSFGGEGCYSPEQARKTLGTDKE